MRCCCVSLALGHPTSHDSTRSKHTVAVAGCCCRPAVPYYPVIWRGAFAGARAHERLSEPHALHGHALVEAAAAPPGSTSRNAKACTVSVRRRASRSPRRASWPARSRAALHRRRAGGQAKATPLMMIQEVGRGPRRRPGPCVCRRCARTAQRRILTNRTTV
jgi:hypothetical protein